MNTSVRYLRALSVCWFLFSCGASVMLVLAAVSTVRTELWSSVLSHTAVDPFLLAAALGSLLQGAFVLAFGYVVAAVAEKKLQEK